MYGKLKSIVIAPLFPFIYFVCQLLMQILFIYGIRFYVKSRGINAEKEYMDIANNNLYIMTLCAALLCFGVLIIINKIKKQPILEYYKKISFTQGIVYIISTIGIYIAIVIMNGILMPFFPEYSNEIMDFFQLQQPWLGIIVIGIVAPLIEELIFRGEVYKELDKHFSTPAVIILQALLFGLIHPILLQKIQTFIIGIFLGYARAKTDNIWPSTIMHITNNMIACLLVFGVSHM